MTGRAAGGTAHTGGGLLSLFSILKDNLFAKIALFIIAGTGAAIYFAYTVVWTEIIHPRIDRFILAEINDYFSGDLAKRTSKYNGKINDTAVDRFLAEKIRDYNSGKLAKLSGADARNSIDEKLQEISDAVFSQVDSVYTIDKEYFLNSSEKAKPIHLYFYADPDKHDVKVFVYSKGIIPYKGRLDFELRVNKRKISFDSKFEDEITKILRKHPLQGSGGMGRDDDTELGTYFRHSKYIQLIEIIANIPPPPPSNKVSVSEVGTGPSVTIHGYVLVTRRRVAPFLQHSTKNERRN